MPQITTTIEDCARCGNKHEAIEFKELVRSIKLQRATAMSGGQFVFELTHWAPCPTTQEPVLLRFANEAEV